MYPYFNNRWNIEYSTRYVSGPNPEPVTIDDVYKALQIDASNAFDAGDLMASARAARIEAEGILNQKIGPQVWDIIVDFWPVNWCLPLQPVSAINGIYWLDWNGIEHTVDPNIYAFYPAMNRLWLKPGYFWPDGEILPAGAIRIRSNRRDSSRQNNRQRQESNPATHRYAREHSRGYDRRHRRASRESRHV
jgi:hypothetical protein